MITMAQLILCNRIHRLDQRATFYQPGVYNLFCRLATTIMFTIVRVE